MDDLPLFRIVISPGAGIQPTFRNAFSAYTDLVINEKRASLLPSVENVLLSWVSSAVLEHARDGMAGQSEEYHADFVFPKFRLSARAVIAS